MDTVNQEMPYTTDSTGTVRKTQGQTMGNYTYMYLDRVGVIF